MQKVAVSKTKSSYPRFPFSPSETYPEYFFDDPLSEENTVYAAVRNNFYLLGYDNQRFGHKDWNPFGWMISPGAKVFIKPNWVDSRHRFGDNIWSVITHPSVIRCVIDYVSIALGFTGTITIGDNPHVDADFDIIRKECFLGELKEFYASRCSIRLEFIDCRIWQVEDLRYYGYKKRRKRLAGDSSGYVTVDLGDSSLFNGISPKLFRGTYNDRRETMRFHTKSHHMYSFAGSMYKADVFISIPKLKTHSKVGATLNIKGLIGTIGEKNGLVHWRIGFPAFGGDEYGRPAKKSDYVKLFLQHFITDSIPEDVILFLRDRLNSNSFGKAFLDFFLIGFQKKKKLRGAVAFNDTTWRTVADVYHAFVTRSVSPRFFSVIDGVMGGDTDGPHFPNPVNSNVIVSGSDLLSTDLAAVRLMDFDYTRIRYLDRLFLKESNTARNSVDSIDVVSNDFDTSDFFSRDKRYLGFRPPNGWKDLSLFGIEPGRDYTADNR
jgi:uncharacterized protein (DUF362 family)